MIILKEILRSFFSFLIIIIFVLIAVAFLTLLERKVLGYIQIRKGPNKVGLGGILQPFSDAIKLFSKEGAIPYKSNYLIYYFCPVISFFLVFTSWRLMPFQWGIINFSFRILFFIVMLRLGVYRIIIAGWASNSRYALIGGLRAVAQTISYEVRLAFIFLNIIVITIRYRILDFYLFQNYCWFIFTSVPLFQLFFTRILAETNRTPFDFAEGESELVSGFNIEYRRGGFVLIFLAEYGRILLIRIIISVIFLGGNLMNFFFFVKVTFLGFLFIWLRGVLPRYRYDKLINLCWKSFLPISLFCLIFYFSLKTFIVLNLL